MMSSLLIIDDVFNEIKKVTSYGNMFEIHIIILNFIGEEYDVDFILFLIRELLIPNIYYTVALILLSIIYV